MTKLLCAGLALALSLSACVTDDDVGTPQPEPTEDQSDNPQPADDELPVGQTDSLPTPCAPFTGKGDNPCAP